MVFSEKLRILCEMRGISQAQVAKDLGVSQNLVSLWARGKSLPDLYEAARLARIFNVKVEYLSDDELDDPFLASGLTPEESTVLTFYRILNIKPDDAIAALSIFMDVDKMQERISRLHSLPATSDRRRKYQTAQGEESMGREIDEEADRKRLAEIEARSKITLRELISLWNELRELKGAINGFLKKSSPEKFTPEQGLVIGFDDDFDFSEAGFSKEDAARQIGAVLELLTETKIPVFLVPRPVPPEAGAPDSADAIKAVKEGSAVLHPEYGVGRVTKLTGKDLERKATIEFQLGGRRTFWLAKTPLRLVEDQTPPLKLSEVDRAWHELEEKFDEPLRSALASVGPTRIHRPSTIVVEVAPELVAVRRLFLEPAALQALQDTLGQLLGKPVSVEFVPESKHQ